MLEGLGFKGLGFTVELRIKGLRCIELASLRV